MMSANVLSPSARPHYSQQYSNNDEDNDVLSGVYEFSFLDAYDSLDQAGRVNMNTKVFQFNEAVQVVDVTGKITEAPLARGDGFWNTLQYEYEIGTIKGAPASDNEFNQSLSFQEIQDGYLETGFGSGSLSLTDLRSLSGSISMVNSFNTAERSDELLVRESESWTNEDDHGEVDENRGENFDDGVENSSLPDEDHSTAEDDDSRRERTINAQNIIMLPKSLSAQ
jgi:hypothetical protein